jgi:hypothetical protein
MLENNLSGEPGRPGAFWSKYRLREVSVGASADQNVRQAATSKTDLSFFLFPTGKKIG